MGRWRGYIIAERSGYRGAMRSPHTKTTEAGAIRDIKRENKEWNSVNSDNHSVHMRYHEVLLIDLHQVQVEMGLCSNIMIKRKVML